MVGGCVCVCGWLGVPTDYLVCTLLGCDNKTLYKSPDRMKQPTLASHIKLILSTMSIKKKPLIKTQTNRLTENDACLVLLANIRNSFSFSFKSARVYLVCLTCLGNYWLAQNELALKFYLIEFCYHYKSNMPNLNTETKGGIKVSKPSIDKFDSYHQYHINCVTKCLSFRSAQRIHILPSLFIERIWSFAIKEYSHSSKSN